MVRQPISCRSKTFLKKGTWSPEEDRKLIDYIMRYGIWNWNEMAKYAGLSRSGKSCRLRWMNYLRPNIKLGNFTREEEDTIVQLQKMLGNRWSAIAARLPQRTDNDIKNYWNTCLKKRVKNNSASTIASPTENNTGIETEQDNSSDSDSSFLNTLFDSPIPTILEVFPKAATYEFSPLGCNHAAVVDDNYTMEDNFVSDQQCWEIHRSLEQPLPVHRFLEQPLPVIALDNEDCQAMSPNSQLWHQESIYLYPINDFWVSPFI